MMNVSFIWVGIAIGGWLNAIIFYFMMRHANKVIETYWQEIQTHMDREARLESVIRRTYTEFTYSHPEVSSVGLYLSELVTEYNVPEVFQP